MTGKPCYLLIPILLLAVLSGCSGNLSTPPVQSSSDLKPASILVSLTNSAYIKRDGWTDYQPIGFGALVYSTDLLKTNGDVSLLCPDFQTILLLTDYGRNPCPLPASEKSLSYDGMFFSSGPRGISRSDIPYILYPRSTTILESQPIFEWHDTDGSFYTVELWQGTTLIWSQVEVTGNSLQYPVNAPKLLAGKDYLLVVTDKDTGKDSNADPNKGLGFQIISDAQFVEIERQKNVILSLPNLSLVAQKLALAIYYAKLDVNGRGLWGEAGELFGKVVEMEPNAPAVYLWAAETYTKMKLWDEAQTEYKNALLQAQITGDLESQADAIAALWHITGDQSQLEQAINLYEKIGAQDKADNLKKEKMP